ncbi:MAG TPA: hypothetical protein VN848_02060 [Gemmatimonadales bacterium]|nr:hypothetical protein [Gemmatimonadales bacterium]
MRFTPILLLGLLARPAVGQSCALRIDRVKPNGMFEFRVTLSNPREVPVRLTAIHVSYITLTGSHYRKERRDIVSPFQRERLIVQPHQRMTLTTLPAMDPATDDPATATASCAWVVPASKGGGLGD